MAWTVIVTGDHAAGDHAASDHAASSAAGDHPASGAARPGIPRDRDPVGRPLNSRPRDELGRPLPRGASTDVPRIRDDLAVTPDEAAALGGSLLLEGRPFHAHEVFEAAWKSGPATERDLWQGLAQVAVGITHARRGNAQGAVALLHRGAQRVRGYQADGARPHGIDPGFVADRAEEIAVKIGQNGLAAATEDDLLLPLSPS